jgi:L-seryl-tRNA(Ser) seleniumtransferase
VTDPGSTTAEALRAIPSVDRLLGSPAFQPFGERFRRDPLRRFLQMRLDAYRLQLQEGRSPLTRDELLGAQARAWARQWRALTEDGTRRVINATGVLLHTNLGRALLAPRARRAVERAARYPSDLELELATGQRASRLRKLEALLRVLTGAEAGFAVNNNAAALTLAVDSFTRKRRLIVSRGEQVEIGGSFRLPEILGRFAGSMVEVGTTNRTRLADYAGAIRRRGDVLLKVHRSNFRVEGYVEETALAELVALGREKGCIVLYDLGSGRFDGGMPWLREPSLEEALAAGPDLLTFSADKIFGGPQAGIILGRADLVAAMRANPLARALRIDKLSLAALVETLSLRLEKGAPLPTRDLLDRGRPQIRALAESLRASLAAARVPGLDLELRETQARGGGGSAAEDDWPSAGLRLAMRGMSAARLAESLRAADPAVLGTVRQDEFLLDLAAVSEDELDDLARILLRVLKQEGRRSGKGDGHE